MAGPQKNNQGDWSGHILFFGGGFMICVCVCLCVILQRVFVAQSHNDFAGLGFFFGPSNLLIQFGEKQDVSLSEWKYAWNFM